MSAFAAELLTNARLIAAPGKGILAADESTGTLGRRFESIGVANTLENRVAYREMLFRCPQLEECVSGVILYEETLYGSARDGIPLADLLKANGILVGLKVDLGVKPLYGTEGETVTQGLDDLDERCATAYGAGVRFAKWRAVFRVSSDGGNPGGGGGGQEGGQRSCCPSPLAMEQNAANLARYASICQANGLVPIVEPEVLMDGSHGIQEAAAATEKVLACVFKHLSDHHVMLEGTILKPNMVRPGQACAAGLQANASQIALATVRVLQHVVPCSVPGVTFLSGGMTEEEASLALNAINQLDTVKPWSLSFSFGRALQQSCLQAWKGDPANTAAAQAQLLKRCVANSEAQRGEYAGGVQGAASSTDLAQKNYVY